MYETHAVDFLHMGKLAFLLGSISLFLDSLQYVIWVVFLQVYLKSNVLCLREYGVNDWRKDEKDSTEEEKIMLDYWSTPLA